MMHRPQIDSPAQINTPRQAAVFFFPEKNKKMGGEAEFMFILIVQAHVFGLKNTEFTYIIICLDLFHIYSIV